MATTLRQSHSYSEDGTASRRALAGQGARLIQQGRNGLARAIDVALTAVHLVGALVLAASLVATAAGLVFFPPDRNGHQRPAWASRAIRANCQTGQRWTALRESADCMQDNGPSQWSAATSHRPVLESTAWAADRGDRA